MKTGWKAEERIPIPKRAARPLRDAGAERFSQAGSGSGGAQGRKSARAIPDENPRARISGRKAGQRARTARSRFLSSLGKDADPASSSEKCFRRGGGAAECLRPGKNTPVIPLQHRYLPRGRRRPAEPRPQKNGPPDSGKGQARPVFLCS